MRKEKHAPMTTAETVWECAGGVMYRAAYDVLRSPADAEDAVMDAMVRIVRSEAKFAGLEPNEMRALAVIYARNTAIDLYNRNHRDPLPVEELPEEPDPAPTPEEETVSADEAERLMKQIGRMPPSYRDALLLRVRYGMNDSEIAETLHLSPGTVRTRLSRARSWLRERMDGENEEGGSVR